MEVPGSAAGFRAHWQWPLWEAGAVRCLAASADFPELDGGAVIPASSRRLRAAARSRWSLAPASTCGSGGAWRGPRRYATVALARASGSSRLSVKGAGASMDLPSSWNSADIERAVPVASGMPALAAAPTPHRQVKAGCWLGASHSREMLPPTVAAVRSLGALGLL